MIDTNPDIISSRLEDVMRSRGLNDRDVELMTGVSKSVVNAIRNGERNSPSVWTVANLCDGLDVPVEYMIGMSDVISKGIIAREICNSTGLPLDVVEYLRRLRGMGPSFSGLIGEFIDDLGFWESLNTSLDEVASKATEFFARRPQRATAEDKQIYADIYLIHAELHRLCDKFLEAYLNGRGKKSQQYYIAYRNKQEKRRQENGHDPQENE